MLHSVIYEQIDYLLQAENTNVEPGIDDAIEVRRTNKLIEGISQLGDKLKKGSKVITTGTETITLSREDQTDGSHIITITKESIGSPKIKTIITINSNDPTHPERTIYKDDEVVNNKQKNNLTKAVAQVVAEVRSKLSE